MAKERKRGRVVESDFCDPWEPGEGEVLEGTYIGVDNVPTKRGDKESFKSYRIRVDGQEKPVGVSGAFLESKMRRIKLGTYLWITYKGKVQTNNGPAKDYEVEIEEGAQLLDMRADTDD